VFSPFIKGFLSGTRYQAVSAQRKYPGLYETDSLEAFTSADYHAAFTCQTLPLTIDSAALSAWQASLLIMSLRVC
jgi:hypothetical protein